MKKKKGQQEKKDKEVGDKVRNRTGERQRETKIIC